MINLEKLMGVTLSTVITLYLWGAAVKLSPDDPKLMTIYNWCN